MNSQLTRLSITAAVLIALCSPLLTATARADTADRKFGGCVGADGETCFGPSASISLASYDLRSAQFSAGVIPGAGYGVTLFSNKWYNVGANFYLSLVVESDKPTTMTPALVMSFAEYLRVGVGYDIVTAKGGVPSTHDPIILFGLGLDFGKTPQSVAGGLMNSIH